MKIYYFDRYGSHTFKMVNQKGEAVYVKFHMKTDQGIKNLPVDKAHQLSADDPDYSIHDLYNSIAEGNYPSWTMKIQVMTFEEAERYKWNPFDVTKIWQQKDFPLITVGKLVLNRNPENYFAEVEQIAFSPANMVPGIEPSPDKMLQGRLFSYTGESSIDKIVRWRNEIETDKTYLTYSPIMPFYYTKIC